MWIPSFVDRDMFMRFLGIGIGHCNQYSPEAERGDGELGAMDDDESDQDMDGNNTMRSDDDNGTWDSDDDDEDSTLISDDDSEEFDNDDNDLGYDDL